MANYGLLEFTDGFGSYASSQEVKGAFTVNGSNTTITNGYNLRYTDTDTTATKALLTVTLEGLSALAGAELRIDIGSDTYSVPIPSASSFSFSDMCLDLTSGTCTRTFSMTIVPYVGQPSVNITNCSAVFIAYHLEGGFE